MLPAVRWKHHWCLLAKQYASVVAHEVARVTSPSNDDAKVCNHMNVMLGQHNTKRVIATVC